MDAGDSIFFNCFGIIRDTRQQAKVRHLLIDILFISVAERVLRWIDPKQFEKYFVHWVMEIAVLSLKWNQPNLHQDVVDFFEDAEKTKFDEINVKSCTTTDKGHGRIETSEKENHHF